jgi:cytochrome c oxidase assembly protein subunit 15
MQKSVSETRPIGIWLLLCAGMVFGMAVLGAITRLTGSGLSMVDWQPVQEFLPPLGAADWQAQFAAYQQSPQYRLLNAGMSLADYRHIFFWEWFHRLWGKLIGVAFLLPFLWFVATGRIGRSLIPKLALLFLLGGLQGFVGWFMVRSGLVDRPSVSHYRLAMHLALALALYAALLWAGLAAIRGQRSEVRKTTLRPHAWLALACIALTMVWGAFVAGLQAGLIYNTFPLMGGHLMPSEMWFLHPLWLNVFANHAAVQFTHRMLALTTALVVLVLAIRGTNPRQPQAIRHTAIALGLAVIAQVSLGIATVVYAVPVPLGALHQAGAITVLTAMVVLLFLLRAPGRASASRPAIAGAPPTETAP